MMMSYNYHAHEYSNLEHIIFVHTYTYMYISHIHVSTSGKFLLLRNIRGKQMVMWYSRSITHTSRSIYLSARQCVKKQRRVGQEKMVGRWNVGKTAVLAVLLNCIVSGTTISACQCT